MRGEHDPTVAAATDSGSGSRGPTSARSAGTVVRVVEIAVEDFEGLVGDALDEIPDALARLIDNVVVLVEDRHETEDLLGLYDGVPLTERDDYGGLVMPDRITIYRLPICEICRTRDEVVEEVLVTVVHEIAHHFGIEDDELHRMGWG